MSALFIVGLTIVIILVIVSLVLDGIASSKVTTCKTCTVRNVDAIVTYSNYAIICSIVALVFTGITIFVYAYYVYVKGEGQKDDTQALVNAATVALQRHAAKLNKHATIIDTAFDTLAPVTKLVNSTCDTAKGSGVCNMNLQAPQNPLQKMFGQKPGQPFQFG
jgi:hypothetical protein